MHRSRRKSLLSCLLVLAAAFIALPPAHAADPVELRWWQLAPLPPDARWELLRQISARRRVTQRLNACMKPLSDLMIAYDGARVTISGFAVPLDGDEGPAKPFLLVPFAGACDKFPPTRNQVILVTPAPGRALDKFDDPVVVTGVLRTLPAQTRLGEAGYRLTADIIAPER